MKKNPTIGVLIGNANSPHTMNMMRGLTEGATKFQVNILFFLGIHSSYCYRSYFGEDSTSNFDHQFNIVYDYAWLGKIDAMIIPFGSLGIFLDNPDKSAFLSRLPQVPYIYVEETDPDLAASSIITDNYAGMYELMEHMITEHHYKKFTYLSGPIENTDAIQRLRAFKDILRKYQIPYEESQIAYGDFTECVDNSVNFLLDHFPDMDAMICANDLMAHTACKECQKRGLYPGRDIAITGYDDSIAAAYMNPPLTTVLQDSFQMGFLAIENVLKLLNGKSPSNILLPGKLICRSSCGCHYSQPLPSAESVIYQLQESASMYQQETWFLPLISRDMLDHLDNERDFFFNAVQKLYGLRAKNSYLYLFEKPVTHKQNQEWTIPDTLYLAAFHEGKKIVSYFTEERPVVTFENGICSFHPKESCFSMSIFCLFCGDIQYGILLTEIEPDNLPLSYLISMQIGSALHNYHLSQKQKETQKMLEALVKELNGKNQILNFISEYDSLTSCLNRRGFLERAVLMNQEHIDSTGYIIFADLDHLKEINDNFGHSEGDFAIIHCASMLRTSFSEHGLVGRIGGDEFVAFLCGTRMDIESCLSCLKELQDNFNITDQKPYYIELSFGYEKFICSEDIDFPTLLSKADRALYLNKLKRRKSIKK